MHPAESYRYFPAGQPLERLDRGILRPCNSASDCHGLTDMLADVRDGETGPESGSGTNKNFLEGRRGLAKSIYHISNLHWQ